MRCVIGIDLGTSRSGYSYAFGPEPPHVKFPHQYTKDDLTGQAKTDTALLFEVLDSGSWRLEDWGTRAVNRYTQLSGADQQYRLVLGKQFKLALRTPDPSQLKADCQLPPDCPFSAAELITTMLKGLREHARDRLKDSVGYNIDTAEVHYCLSVPAGWSLKAKRIMRYAAEQAGMTPSNSTSSSSSSTSSRDSSQARDQFGPPRGVTSDVVLIHEPEAAALTACIDPMGDVPTLQAVPGHVWMILDAGGGTVDIAMHQLEASKTHPGQSQFSELLRSRCLLLGSSMLDAQAESELLLPLFGSEAAYDKWKQDHPHSYIQQMRDWEEVKSKFDGNNTEQIRLEHGLLQALKEQKIDMPAVNSGRLPVTAENMRKLVFEPVLQPILKNVREMLTAQHSTGRTGADILVLAGGFGSSPYLQQRLTQECGSMLQRPPVMPNNAARAVVLGNTLHLQRPDAIRVRVSRLTYGINLADKPTDSCRQHGKVISDSKDRTWCETHFRAVVRNNEEVEIGKKTPAITVYPMPGATHIQVPVFATEAVNALHVTEPGMSQVGVVYVKVEKAHKVNLGFLKAGRMSTDKYKVELSFRFGTAEAEVLAFDVVNQRKVLAEFVFSNEAAGAEHNCRVHLPSAVAGPAALAANRLQGLQL